MEETNTMSAGFSRAAVHEGRNELRGMEKESEGQEWGGRGRVRHSGNAPHESGREINSSRRKVLRVCVERFWQGLIWLLRAEGLRRGEGAILGFLHIPVYK